MTESLTDSRTRRALEGLICLIYQYEVEIFWNELEKCVLRNIDVCIFALYVARAVNSCLWQSAVGWRQQSRKSLLVRNLKYWAGDKYQFMNQWWDITQRSPYQAFCRSLWRSQQRNLLMTLNETCTLLANWLRRQPWLRRGGRIRTSAPCQVKQLYTKECCALQFWGSSMMICKTSYTSRSLQSIIGALALTPVQDGLWHNRWGFWDIMARSILCRCDWQSLRCLHAKIENLTVVECIMPLGRLLIRADTLFISKSK